MEVEAKYRVHQETTFERFIAATEIGGYRLAPLPDQWTRDRYYDTPTRALIRAGYACRVREQEGIWIGGLKSLGNAQGAVHRREEYEQPIFPHTLPPDWPEGPLKDRVMAIVQDQPLQLLCEIQQQRRRRLVYHGERCVGELSLDQVDMRVGEHRWQGYEVELELGPEGFLEDLHALGAIFEGWGAIPERRSKFERAMDFLLET